MPGRRYLLIEENGCFIPAKQIVDTGEVVILWSGEPFRSLQAALAELREAAKADLPGGGSRWLGGFPHSVERKIGRLTVQIKEEP